MQLSARSIAGVQKIIRSTLVDACMVIRYQSDGYQAPVEMERASSVCRLSLEHKTVEGAEGRKITYVGSAIFSGEALDFGTFTDLAQAGDFLQVDGVQYRIERAASACVHGVVVMHAAFLAM